MIRLTLESLMQLQDLDRKILALRALSHPGEKVKEKAEELERLKLMEQLKQGALDELRMMRSQNQGALENCRVQIAKARSDEGKRAGKDMVSREAQRTMQGELDSQENLLELKGRKIERERNIALGQLQDIQLRLQRIQRELETLPTKLEEATASIAEMEARRSDVCSKIPTQFLMTYQRLAALRGGIGIVRLQGHTCGGCNMLLPAQFVNDLRRSSKLEQCQNCRRLLVVALNS